MAWAMLPGMLAVALSTSSRVTSSAASLAQEGLEFEVKQSFKRRACLARRCRVRLGGPDGGRFHGSDSTTGPLMKAPQGTARAAGQSRGASQAVFWRAGSRARPSPTRRRGWRPARHRLQSRGGGPGDGPEAGACTRRSGPGSARAGRRRGPGRDGRGGDRRAGPGAYRGRRGGAVALPGGGPAGRGAAREGVSIKRPDAGA